MIIGKKRILLGSAGLLILIMAALMFSGCSTPPNAGPPTEVPGPATTDAEPNFVNTPDAPVTINSLRVQPAPMYYDVFIDYTNNTAKMISQTEFCVLLFDENGNPVFDTHAQGSAKFINSKKQLVPYGSMSGRWLVQLGTQKVKGHLVRVTFFDGTTWEDPGLVEWVEAEIAKY
jgi:hypothetical protein